MAKLKTKKLTAKYWNALPEGSRKRALQACFPIHPSIVDMLLHEKATPKGNWWGEIVFKKVRIPEDNEYYKTVVNNTYYA